MIELRLCKWDTRYASIHANCERVMRGVDFLGTVSLLVDGRWNELKSTSPGHALKWLDASKRFTRRDFNIGEGSREGCAGLDSEIQQPYRVRIPSICIGD